MLWVKDADFAHNNFTVVNITELMILFLNINRLDLRDNPIKCLPTTLVKILSDCPPTISSTTISSPTTHPNVSTKYSRITATTLLVNISSTAITPGKRKSNLVLFIVLPVCITVCFVFVCFLFVCLMKRRRHPTNNIRMVTFFSIVSSDSDSDSKSSL